MIVTTVRVISAIEEEVETVVHLTSSQIQGIPLLLNRGSDDVMMELSSNSCLTAVRV